MKVPVGAGQAVPFGLFESGLGLCLAYFQLPQKAAFVACVFPAGLLMVLGGGL
jgi:hypothetical protein